MNRIADLISHAQTVAERAGTSLRWFSPTLARCIVGTVFAQSGWGKLHNLPGVIEYFTELGLPAPAFQAVLASSTELVCGSLVLLGLATRLAALPLIATMAVAIRTALWAQVDGLGSLFGLAEFLYIALLVWLATDGAGPLSADALRVRRRAGAAADALPWAASRASS